MRINKLHIAIASITTLGLLGCEVNGWGDGSDPTGDYETPATTPDDPTTSLPTDPTAPLPDDPNLGESPDAGPFYAVFLEDRWDERCATSGVGAHGADIDAIGLWDPTYDPDNPELVGWLDVIDMQLDRTICEGYEYGYTDPDLAMGPPDGELTEGFYSLAGGWLIGEFDNQVEILPHYIITVHEIDDVFCAGLSWCVGSEGYDVYLATELDCVNTGPDFRETCMVPLTSVNGAEGSATLPATIR